MTMYYSVSITTTFPVVGQPARISYFVYREQDSEEYPFTPGIHTLSQDQREQSYAVHVLAASPEEAVAIAINDYQPDFPVVSAEDYGAAEHESGGGEVDPSLAG